ncbi:MAG: DMT family transporter [Gammaproteobacteria bacterium]|nr:DMT family transporter [Gammaproteobacteria bacterium]
MKYLRSLSLNSQGILCLVSAVVFLSASDSIIKWLSPTYALHEIMLFRSLFAMLLVFVIIHLEGGLKTLKTRRPLLHFLRGSLLVLANMFFFLGLATLAFAETVALFFVAPLFICILSQPVLGEKVGAMRWLVILVGFGGVLIMLRPGAEVFTLTSLLPILAALCYALMQMLTRKLGMQEKAGTLTFYIQFAFIVISSVIGLSIGDGRYNKFDNPTFDFLLRPWTVPVPADFALLAICGLIVAIGGYLLSQAYRLGQASVVSPFEYTSLPFALILGYYLWGDWPDWISIAGSGFIIFSGFLIVYVENRDNRRGLNRLPHKEY